METAREFIYPKLKDPRWIFFIFSGSFVLYAISSPGFTRTPEQFFTAVLTCILLDFLLLYFYKKVFMFPLSGLLSSFGLFLMCDTPFVWPLFLGGVLIVFSKHFIAIDNRHVFNPNNFAIVLMSLFLPNIVTVTSGRWGGNIYVMYYLFLLGSFLCYKINRHTLVISYVITFVIGAWIRSLILNIPFLTILGPGTGAAFQLFIFYHITDPLTTPQKKSHQVIFAICIGVLDTYLRYEKNKFAPFLSYFIIAGFYSFLKAQFNLDQNKKTWVLGFLRMEKRKIEKL